MISPDGPLARLPFELLPFGKALAVESAVINYTQSLSVLVQLAERRRSYRSLDRRIPLLAFGNPEYGSPQSSTSGRMRSLPDGASPAWEPLPASADELARVSAIYGRSARVFSGTAASEQQLKALSASGRLREARTLLFSAHGLVSDASPSLSAIVLAQHRVDTANDGLITAAEWPVYDFRSDLIVLSACETAAGKVVSGEGMLGLPYAMFVAGNTESLLTLWKIEDRGAAEFTARFFERLRRGAPPGVALTATKRDFLRSPRRAHPFYWAPYVLYGG